jgi:hypothetical protein
MSTRSAKKALTESRERARRRLCESAMELADTLIVIALGETKAEPQQVRASTSAHDRIGVSDRIEIDLEGHVDHTND